MKHADIRAKFLLPSEGGRSSSLASRAWGHYMPHLRVAGEEAYLGVKFLQGPSEAITPGLDYDFEIEFMYPNVDYGSLVPGALFDVLEGARVVARGEVIQLDAKVTPKKYGVEAMTVNERLSQFKLLDEFDRAVASGRLQDVISVLKRAKLTAEQARETAERSLRTHGNTDSD